MKRVLSLFLSCIFVLGVCFSTPIIASAAELTFEDDGNVFQYEENNECSIKKWGNTEVESLIVSDIVKKGDVVYTITGILSGAFSGCEKLESITIKSNIETIEAGAFAGCTALTEFIEDANSLNSNFEVDAGVLFNENQTTLIAYPAGKTNVTTYTIPATVTEIADGAFSGCKSLETITVAEGNTAFSVTEDGILFNANKTKLVAYPSGKIAETYTIPTTVTEIADGAFSGCKSLETITVAADNTVFSATEDGVLFNQEGTKLIAYPAAKTGTEYTIPEGVEEIADGAFAGCVNLKYIFTEKTSFEEITIGVNNNIFSQPGVYHKGMTDHSYADVEGSKKCTVCELVCTHTWETGVCTECGLVCEHTGLTCGEEGECEICDETYTASHEWTFTKLDDGNVIRATCDNLNCNYNSEQITITLVAPTGELVYDKNSKVAIVTDDSEENIFENTKITYESKSVNEDDGVVYTPLEGEDLPTNAGTYRASITLGEGEKAKSVSVEFTIEKATPTIDKFTVALPENLTYDGGAKTATVVVKDGVTGMGDVTVKYYLVVDGVVAEDGSTVAPTNAGTYTVKVDVAEGINYNLKTFESAEWTFTIEKATPTIDNFTVTLPENLNYDGDAKTAVVVVEDGVTGMGDVTVKYYEVLENGETQSLEGAPSEEGTYIVKIDVAEGTNYNSATFESTEWTFTIKEHVHHSWSFDAVDGEGNENKIKATCEGAGSCIYQTEGVTITLEAPKAPVGETSSLIYDDSVKKATVTDDSEENIFENTKITYESKSVNEDDGVVYTPLEGEDLPTNAGTYRASITLGEGEKAKSVSVEFTIEKATPTIDKFTVALPENLTYDGGAKTATVVVKDGVTGMGDVTVKYYLVVDGVVAEDGSTVAPTNAGTYTVKVDVAEGINYNLKTFESAEWTFTIEKATPTIDNFTVTLPENLNYDGDAKTAVVVVEDGVTGMGDVTVKYYEVLENGETQSLEGAPSEEGTYIVKIDVAEGTNYNSATFESTEWTFTIKEHVHHSWSFDAVDGEGNENKIKATCEGAGSCIYQTEGVTITLEAPKAPVGETSSLIYDDSVKKATVTDDSEENIFENTKITYESKSVNEDDGVVYTPLEGEDLPTNAGTYRASITLGEGEKAKSVSVEFTIEKATPTIDKFTVALPENLTYDGGAKTATVVVKDGVTGMGDVTVKYYLVVDGVVAEDGSTVAPTNAGTYTVKVDVAEGINYNLKTFESAEWTFTIEKATPTIDNFTVTLPENLNYDGDAKTAVVVVEDGVTGMGDVTVKYYEVLENGETQSLEGAPSEEGTYIVKIDVAEGTNYNSATFESTEWTFTIKEHVHSWQYSASGVVITATCQNAGCEIKTTTVELVAPENLVYDGTEKSVTVKATHADLLDEYTLTNMTATDAGKYTTFIKLGNATASLDFEISKAVIVVTKVTATNRVYNGTLAVEIDKDADIEFTGLASGDKVSFDLSALKGTLDDANAGENNKVVTITGSIVLTGEDAGNYWVSTPKTTTVKITPATLTITPDAKSSEQYYDLPALTYKVNGLIGGDELTKTPKLTTNADIKTVGNYYTITATGAEASANYVIEYATAPLTITAHKNHIVKDGTWKVTVPGTCKVAGKEEGTCTLCSGTVTRDSKIDPNNHALITTVTKKETCTQNGEALVTCANGCSYSLKTTLPADGELHNFAEDFTVIESTCVAKGSKYKVCQNPGCKVVSEKTEIAINPDAHKNIVTVNAKDATCETKGYTGDKVCNDCKKTTDPGIEINAKGHTESDWIVDKEPTFTEEGAKHTACTVCKKELKKEVIAKRALEVPEVKIENASNGIKVSWSQDEDATGYTVYSSTYNATTKKWSAWKNRGTAAATKSSWTDKTVSEGVTYRYTVRSVNGTNKSNYKATSGLCYVVAPKVTVSITSTGLLAKWNKVNNATSYIVYRRALVNGVWSSWVNLGSTKAEKNTWSDTSVQSGVTYRYTVRAVVGKVKSGYTASSSIIYLAQPLLKISNANTGITGKWDPIAGATGYTIYRSEYNPSTKKWSKWLTLGTTGATAKTFTDKTVKSGYEYKYTIRAVSGKFKSTYQDSNKLVYLAQPTLKISNVANGIQGKWSQVNGATGYIIYRRELKDGKWSNWTSLGTTKSTAKSFTDKTVKSGVTYSYTIRAKNGSYKSSYVSTGSLVFLSVPTVKISNGITGVNVSWSKIEGATSYLVYRRELVDGKWTKWAEFKTVSETSLVDETVKSGTNYRYTVRALNGKSRSMYTSTGTLYYLTAPTVTVEKVDAVVKVNWTQTVGAKGYTIYRAELGADGKWSKWVTLGTATEKYSSCKDKTAKTGVTYKYTVRAVNGKVKSAYVDGAQITNQ